jgi:nucleotide-binding universal stress UspA family protein
MSSEGKANTNDEERSKEQEEEEPTLPAETSQDNPTAPAEKRVITAKPTKTEYGLKASEQEEEQEEESLTSKAKGAGQSFKDLFKSTGKKETPSVASQPRVSDANLEYNRILIPHDGSEMSDKALNHAIYLSKISGAEIVIIYVVEHIHNVDSSTVMATSKEEGGREEEKEEVEKSKKEDFEITVEGEVKEMIEDRMRFCKQAGIKSQVSYKIQTGRPVNEIVKLSEDMNVDLIVMASSKIPSLARGLLGSTTRKVIDKVEKPVLIVHG